MSGTASMGRFRNAAIPTATTSSVMIATSSRARSAASTNRSAMSLVSRQLVFQEERLEREAAVGYDTLPGLEPRLHLHHVACLLAEREGAHEVGPRRLLNKRRRLAAHALDCGLGNYHHRTRGRPRQRDDRGCEHAWPEQAIRVVDFDARSGRARALVEHVAEVGDRSVEPCVRVRIDPDLDILADRDL